MPRGFYRAPKGFRAWVRVSSRRDAFDMLVTKRFPRNTSLGDIRAWRTEMRSRLRQRLEQRRQTLAAIRGVPDTFHADAQRYLLSVTAMPTYKERCREIALWTELFGDRHRYSIAPHEIRTVRDRWLTVGPRRCWQKVNGVGQWGNVVAPLSASTVNHRLRALSNLWTVLDGRHAPNPVRDEVPEVDEPADVPRALDYHTIRRILDAMSDQGRAPRGEKRRTYSLAKARARVMAWTGVTPKELALITPPDVRWDEALLVVPARRKGHGAPGRLVPLGPEAIAALRHFARLDAYGRFRARVVLRAWQQACRIVIGRTARLYDLRHSFITGVVRATGSMATAQLLAGHTDPRTTRRYATAAVLPLLRAGIDAFATTVASQEKPQ